MKIKLKISARKELLNHGLIVGKSGAGKSTLVLWLIYYLIKISNFSRKHAVLVIDPHSDTAKACMSFAIQDRSRLIYLSSSITSELKTDKEYTCCINPFVTNDNSAEMRYLLTETLCQNLCELLADATLTTQMITVIRPCIATVLRIEDPAQRNLSTLARFFREGENLDLIEFGKTSEIEQHRIFFNNWHKDTHLQISRNSLNVKLSYFNQDPRLSAILNGVPTVDLEAAINSGAVIVLNLPQGSGGFASKVVGKLCLAQIEALMMRRHNMERAARVPLYVFIEELSFVTPSLGDLLSMARKYGASITICGQSLGQIADTILRKTIMVNTGFKAVGLTDYQDRAAFSKEIGVSAYDLERLRPLQFFLKRTDGRYKAIKFETSIMNRAYFLNKKQKQELLEWLVYESGQYVPVPPPPPPPTTHEQSIVKQQTRKKMPPSSDSMKPAF